MKQTFILLCSLALLAFISAQSSNSQQLNSSFEGTWILDITVNDQNYTDTVWICADQFNSSSLWGSYGLGNAPRGFFIASLLNSSIATGAAHQVFSDEPGRVDLQINTFNGQDVIFFTLHFNNSNGGPQSFNATGIRSTDNNNNTSNNGGSGGDILSGNSTAGGTSGGANNGNNNLSFRDLCMLSNVSNINAFQGFWQSVPLNSSSINSGNNNNNNLFIENSYTATNLSICMNPNITSIENAEVIMMSLNGTQIGSLNGTIFNLFRFLGYRTIDGQKWGQILFLRSENDMLGWWWRSMDEFGSSEEFIKNSNVLVAMNGTQCMANQGGLLNP